MIYIVQNLLPIATATIAGLVFAVFYFRLVEPAGPSSRVGSLLVAAIAEFWFACILAGALILAPPKANPWAMAVGSAVVIWIGFVVPALVVSERHRGLPTRAVVTDCGMWLGVMVVQAVVLHLIGLTAPPVGA